MENITMNIDPVHLAVRCTAEGTQKILNELEAELAEAKVRRDKILVDISKAQAAAEKGDKRQLFVLGSLNKQDQAQGRLVLSIERQVAEAKKRLAMAANQAATAEAKRASVDAAAVPRDKWFAVSAPDGRTVRHRHSSMDALQKELQPGYRAIGQVFGHNEDGTGGFISQPGAPSMLKALLESDGDVLMEWLAARGIAGSDKTVVILPDNNRGLQ
jgi:hypothetical protein